MLRQPMVGKKRSRGQRVSSTTSVTAPIAGWNTTDPLAAMAPKYAIVLENWFPTPTDLELRKGAVDWTVAFTDATKSLLAWNGAASKKLFAATDTGIYEAVNNAIGGGPHPALIPDTPLTKGYVHSTNFSVAGGSFLVVVNGQDKLKLYNGTTWQDIDDVSSPAITGLPTTSLVYVTVAVSRLWFVEKDSMSVHYLPVASIGGALTALPLGQVFTRGGFIVSIGTWTIDGGSGSDDYTVFITSEGEVAVYKGIDPASVSTFSKVGTYYIGEPLGRNCFAKYGGDLLILCQNGLFPLSKALQSANVNRKLTLTNKIDSVFSEVARLYSDQEGWEIVVYPQGNFLLVNVPITETYSEQYVMNTITGAWCKFTGWAATSWKVFDKQLYFTTGQNVALGWTGPNDFGDFIRGAAQQAYNYFNNRGQQKHFKLVRPIVTLNGEVNLQAGLDGDYAMSYFDSISSVTAGANSLWDSAIWDEAFWAAGYSVKRDWLTVFAQECYSAAFRLQVTTKSVNLRWSATDFVYEVGGVL